MHRITYHISIQLNLISHLIKFCTMFYLCVQLHGVISEKKINFAHILFDACSNEMKYNTDPLFQSQILSNMVSNSQKMSS